MSRVLPIRRHIPWKQRVVPPAHVFQLIDNYLGNVDDPKTWTQFAYE